MTFEARSQSASLWKKIVDATKELVTEVNLQCDPTGIHMQSMDASHVALVSMSLRKEGFDMFHMERQCCLGLHLGHFAKVLKTIDNSDSLMLRHSMDDSTLEIESSNAKAGNNNAQGARTSNFVMKLMEIDSDQLTPPGDMDYKAMISMSSAEFSKICRDLAVFGDTITVSINKDGATFSSSGDIGTGSLKYACSVATRAATKLEVGDDDAFGNYRRAGDGANAQRGVKQEVKHEIKHEIDDDEPIMNFVHNPNQDAASEAAGMAVQMSEPVELSFALRYFTNFSKGQALSDRVHISLCADQPCMVEYTIENAGFVRYFLGPKVEAGE